MRSRFIPKGAERPIGQVPAIVLVLFVCALLGQLVFNVWRPSVATESAQPDTPPAMAWLRVGSLGEPAALARVANLWLQSMDYSNGKLTRLHELDYDALAAWLERCLALDPSSEYPLFLASRVFSQVKDPHRARIMLDLVARAYVVDPATRWPSMAQAVHVAKHRLRDLPLALAYAKILRKQASGAVPTWARDLDILVLQDLNELESAKILVGGLLNERRITDRTELEFLKRELSQIELRMRGQNH